MNLIYLGAEVGSNRVLLESMGVKTVGISYSRIVARGEPKTKKWLISERFEDDAVVIASPGISETDGMTVGEYEDFNKAYQEFIFNNESRLAGIIEFAPVPLGPEWASAQREVYADLDEKFWPVWRPEQGFSNLAYLSTSYKNVAIPGAEVLNNSAHQIVGHMRSAMATYGTEFHGLGVSSPESLYQTPLSTASTLSWTQAMRNGETIVWDGTRLVRYPARMKDQARPRYKNIIEQAGLDYAAILADDNKEVTRLAIWAYQQLEKDMDKKKPGNNPFTLIEGGNDVTNSDPTEMELTGNSTIDVANRANSFVQPRARTVKAREASQRQYLPNARVTTKSVVEALGDGTEVVREAPIITRLYSLEHVL